MHVEKDPETIFPGEQEDFSNCSNVGKLTFLLFCCRDEASGLNQRVAKE